MKRVAALMFLAFLAGASWLVPSAKAQEDQFQVGAYGDYFRVSQTSSNLGGLGGRVGYKMFSHVMFEGEINYDFEQGFTEICTNCTTLTVAPSNLRVLHGLGGFKVIGTRHAIRPFLLLKGGFINFQLSSRPPSFSGFVSAVDNLRSNNVSGVFYPGAGVEGHVGPIGLRLEAGDEIYWTGKPHHNARVAVGPFIRF